MKIMEFLSLGGYDKGFYDISSAFNEVCLFAFHVITKDDIKVPETSITAVIANQIRPFMLSGYFIILKCCFKILIRWRELNIENNTPQQKNKIGTYELNTISISLLLSLFK